MFVNERKQPVGVYKVLCKAEDQKKKGNGGGDYKKRRLSSVDGDLVVGYGSYSSDDILAQPLHGYHPVFLHVESLLSRQSTVHKLYYRAAIKSSAPH